MKRKTPLLFAIAALAAAIGWNAASANAPAALTPAAASLPAGLVSTADHGKFKELQKPFASGPEVTKACLSCHTEAAKQVQKTKHWTWEYADPK